MFTLGVTIVAVIGIIWVDGGGGILFDFGDRNKWIKLFIVFPQKFHHRVTNVLFNVLTSKKK